MTAWINVRLENVDADALLAACEESLNAGLDFGPGLHAHNVEAAGRKIEAVADLKRRGIDTDSAPTGTEAVAKAMAEWSSDKPWAERHPNNRAFWLSVAEAVMTLSREESAPILAKAKALRPTQGEEG